MRGGELNLFSFSIMASSLLLKYSEALKLYRSLNFKLVGFIVKYGINLTADFFQLSNWS